MLLPYDEQTHILIDEFAVREFNIVLIHHSIVHGGVNLDMTEQPLHLFHRHTFVDSHCCKGTTELVRMDFGHRKCVS